jgi:hypothetical protein
MSTLPCGSPGQAPFFVLFRVVCGQKNEVIDKPAAREAGINEGVTRFSQSPQSKNTYLSYFSRISDAKN